MMERRGLNYVIVWAGLSLCTLVLSAVVLRLPTYYGLAARGVATQGRVEAEERHSDRYLRFSYSVEGQQYEGFGSTGAGTPEYEDVRVGDTVVVFYDPRAPETSFIGDPAGQLHSIIRLVAFITVAFPLFGLLALRRLLHKRDNVDEQS